MKATAGGCISKDKNHRMEIEVGSYIGKVEGSVHVEAGSHRFHLDMSLPDASGLLPGSLPMRFGMCSGSEKGLIKDPGEDDDEWEPQVPSDSEVPPPPLLDDTDDDEWGPPPPDFDEPEDQGWDPWALVREVDEGDEPPPPPPLDDDWEPGPPEEEDWEPTPPGEEDELDLGPPPPDYTSESDGDDWKPSPPPPPGPSETTLGFDPAAYSLSVSPPQDLAEGLVLYRDPESRRTLTFSQILGLKKQKGAGELKRMLHTWEVISRPSSASKYVKFKPIRPDSRAKSISDAMIKHGVPMAASDAYIHVPALTLAPEEFLRWHAQRRLPGEILDKYPELGKNTVLPKYPVMYKTINPDLNPIIMSESLAQRNSLPPLIREQCKALNTELIHQANLTYYGNGSPDGQMGRLAAVMKVAKEVRQELAQVHSGKPSQFANLTSDVELYKLRFPLWERPPEVKINPDHKLYNNFVELTRTLFPYDVEAIDIQWKSDAGPIWGPQVVKREQVFLQDCAIAQRLLDDAGSKSRAEMFKLHPWLRLAKAKPKAEVYLREQFYAKTRNIFALSSCSQLATHILFKAPHAKCVSFLDDPESWSMIGISPFGGTMDKLNSKMAAKRGFVAAYADNMYSFEEYEGEWYWVSLDGVKMEGCLLPSDLQSYNRRVAEWWGDLPPTWYNYLLNIDPAIGCDIVGLLSALQFPVPGMASGKVGTAYYNTAKMIRLIDEWKKLGGTNTIRRGDSGWQLDPLLEKAMQRVGVRLTIELVTPFTDFVPDKIIKMDFLGFDVIKPTAAGINSWLPVLNQVRLFRSVINVKFDQDKMDKNMGQMSAHVLNLARYRALYLIGGWAYTGLDLTLKVLCRSLIERVRGHAAISVQDVNQLVGTMIEDDFFLDKGAQSMINAREVPSLEQVVTVAAGKGPALRMVKNLALELPLDIIGSITDLQPSVWADLADETKTLETFKSTKVKTETPTDNPWKGLIQTKSTREPTPAEMKKANAAYSKLLQIRGTRTYPMEWSKADLPGLKSSDISPRRLRAYIVDMVSQKLSIPKHVIQSFDWDRVVPSDKGMTHGNVLVNEVPSDRPSVPTILRDLAGK